MSCLRQFSLTWGNKVDGPSAVPAAKEYPMAAVQVLLPSLSVYCSMSTNWWMKSMGPVTSLNVGMVDYVVEMEMAKV